MNENIEEMKRLMGNLGPKMGSRFAESFSREEINTPFNETHESLQMKVRQIVNTQNVSSDELELLQVALSNAGSSLYMEQMVIFLRYHGMEV